MLYTIHHLSNLHVGLKYEISLVGNDFEIIIFVFKMRTFKLFLAEANHSFLQNDNKLHLKGVH